MRLNRKQKVIRNLLVSVLLLLLLWAAYGFPPYTVAGMCRQVERQYLLDAVEPLYVLKDKQEFSGDLIATTYTYVLAKAGDEYLEFQYERHLLDNHLYHPRSSNGNIARGALCTARNGMLYVVGPVEEAASATAVVTVEADVSGNPSSRTFELTGERLTEEVLGFRFSSEEDVMAHSFDFGPYNLVDAAWDYYSLTHDSGGRSLLRVEMPCTVTLYDKAGTVLDVMDLTIGTYDILSWR